MDDVYAQIFSHVVTFALGVGALWLRFRNERGQYFRTVAEAHEREISRMSGRLERLEKELMASLTALSDSNKLAMQYELKANELELKLLKCQRDSQGKDTIIERLEEENRRLGGIDATHPLIG
jgi:chromosome segregation ATPase